MNVRPPKAVRPPDGVPVGLGTLLMLWLDSLPCVATNGAHPADAPLTPEEAEKVSAYLSRRGGPAAHGEAVRRAARAC